MAMEPSKFRVSRDPVEMAQQVERMGKLVIQTWANLDAQPKTVEHDEVREKAARYIVDGAYDVWPEEESEGMEE